MDTKLNIKNLISGRKIIVPDYQRAYAWEVGKDDVGQVDQFYQDLSDYLARKSSTPYYFGHFIFEYISDTEYGVIDGQQRLTTIIIFLSTLFCRLRVLSGGRLSEEEQSLYENVIKKKKTYHFDTVEYDNSFFRSYVVNVVDMERRSRGRLDRSSKERIADAKDYFTKKLKKESQEKIRQFLSAVLNATCTTYVVDNIAQAAQMFVFHNNRGKSPTELEVLKARFMYRLHISSMDDTNREDMLESIQESFTQIYKSISLIEHKIKEKDVLLYTQRIYSDSLSERDPYAKIEQSLQEDDDEVIEFIQKFTETLSGCYGALSQFIDLEKENRSGYLLMLEGSRDIVMPFIIKAYMKGGDPKDIMKLTEALGEITILHEVIGIRARRLISALKDVYKDFDGSIDPILEHIDWLKSDIDSCSYWCDTNFKKALNGGNIDHRVAKILLWFYENSLGDSRDKGYRLTCYEYVKKSNLEHIAPQKENPGSGYCKYDESFKNDYLNSLGNFLLLYDSHNKSLSNRPFREKRDSYQHNNQQREVYEMTDEERPRWTKKKIKERREKIVAFLSDHF